MLSLTKKINHHSLYFELALIALALVLGSTVAWHVYTLDINRTLVDQNAHLNISRQIVDSLTPGITQLGFWPPLLHILMAPFVAITPLYRTGLAAFFTLLPFLALASVFLYRTFFLVTKNAAVSFWGAVLFLLNPYVLYYAATPMMEILFLANLTGVAYFLTRWLIGQKLPDLLWTGLFVSLATLSRFEGMILIPLTSAIVVVKLLSLRKRYQEIEALAIIFGILTVIGVGTILSYGYVFGDDPLSFMNSQWSAFSQQREYFLPTQHNLIASFLYYLQASFHILSKPLVIASLAGLVILLLSQRRIEVLAPAIILFSPFVFNYLALVRGDAVVYVPEYPPYGLFFNERYGLNWIGFALFAPVAIFGFLFVKLPKMRAARNMAVGVITAVMLASTVLAGAFLYQIGFVRDYDVVQASGKGYPVEDQRALANALSEHYDFGKILITRARHDIAVVNAGIPLDHYIHESNFRFYDQALDRPWLFARWVVMYNPTAAGNRYGKWTLQNELVWTRLTKSEEFFKHYDLVMENETERLYRLKGDSVLTYAAEMGYDPMKIPSLNPAIESWDPAAIEKEMKVTTGSLALRAAELPAKEALAQNLQEFYTSYLQPEYKKGFYVDRENRGNSESQSYALLQAFWANDPATFETVWRWTAQNLQRPSDDLFAWRFEYLPASNTIRILDQNSATDADTDIAYALFLAGSAWNRQDYLADALAISDDIWRLETVAVGNRRLITAGNWANSSQATVLNPSYFSPVAYRTFAAFDNLHNWNKLVDDGYWLISRASGPEVRPLGAPYLPPDWVVITREGALTPYTAKKDSGDYSYDAFRTLWRVAMDEELHQSRQARDYLSRVREFNRQWANEKSICPFYGNANVRPCLPSIAALSAPLAQFTVTNESAARELMAKYLVINGNLVPADTLSFYDRSWYWFGLRLWTQS